MFATKVKGSLNLHRLSQDHRLDFFVVYSSMIATWGAVHRAHYAAVNHFSDQLILQRNRLGLPGLSIDWGPWSGSGMLKHDAETRAKWLGVDSLKPVRYLCTLGRLLDVHSQGVAIAVEADWQRIYQSYSQHSPMFLFEDLLGPRETATVAESGERPDLGDDSTLRVGIRTAFSELLGYADAREIAEERGFFEQGMDSLLAIRFGEILHERLQVTVKTTDLFSYNSVAKLAEFLAGRGGDDRRLPQPSRAALSFNRIETPMLGAEPMSRSALLDALAEFEESLNEVAQ
jgi:acyl carrier protein